MYLFHKGTKIIIPEAIIKKIFLNVKPPPDMTSVITSHIHRRAKSANPITLPIPIIGILSIYLNQVMASDIIADYRSFHRSGFFLILSFSDDEHTERTDAYGYTGNKHHHVFRCELAW